MPGRCAGALKYNHRNGKLMVKDGIYYGLGALMAALLLAWLVAPAWALLPLALGIFVLWFFRDPERVIPDAPGTIVSPADGKVTEVSTVEVGESCALGSAFS